ncbi:MAG: helix-turn-helix transcriptional regulator [Clostridia bacterium]|nr:helix-turn-helix transcriptional regulator [Clostridia bacterium]
MYIYGKHPENYEKCEKQSQKMEEKLIYELRTTRRNQKISQAELAKRCGLTQSSIGRFEKFEPNYRCTLRIFLKIVKGLGYEVTLKPIEEETKETQKFYIMTKDYPGGISLPERKVYKCIFEHGGATRSQMIEEIDLCSRTIDRALISLSNKKLIEGHGNQRRRIWKIINKENV